jgi:hypothetical protein
MPATNAGHDERWRGTLNLPFLSKVIRTIRPPVGCLEVDASGSWAINAGTTFSRPKPRPAYNASKTSDGFVRRPKD